MPTIKYAFVRSKFVILRLSVGLPARSQPIEQPVPNKGPFKCYVTLFFWKLDPHPPPRNDNNIEHYTLPFFSENQTPPPLHPHLCYVTLEWPQNKDSNQ